MMLSILLYDNTRLLDKKLYETHCLVKSLNRKKVKHTLKTFQILLLKTCGKWLLCKY